MFVAFSSLAWGETQPGANPRINQPYHDLEFATWVARFERSGREVFDKRFEIVESLNLRAGMNVADIGAGTGLFTRLMADRIGPQGVVYAVDISEEFIDNIVLLADQQDLKNVVGIVNNQLSAELKPDSIDLAFICDTYHHFEQPTVFMSTVHEALKKNGQLVVIDFKRQSSVSSDWVMNHVRAGKQQVIEEIETAGFRFEEDLLLLKQNFYLRFTKY